MSVKKPIVKSKSKPSHSSEKHVAVKSKGHEDREHVKEPTTPAPAMDARASKDRRGDDRRQSDVPVPVDRRGGERRAKVNRRRQIDPTTCERDYSPEEVEFMSALDDYKRRSGRMFPTCSEILEVIKGLGYEKRLEVPVAAVQVEALVVAAAGAEQAV